MDEFDEQHYLYQTALYNGLTDTTYADTGVINSAMVIDENRLFWKMRQVDQGGVQRARRGRERGKRNPALFIKLDNEDTEQNERSYPCTKSRYCYVGFAKPLIRSDLFPLLHTTTPFGLTSSLHQGAGR